MTDKAKVEVKIEKEEYLTLQDLEEEMADFITITLRDGKKVKMKKLAQEESARIKRETIQMKGLKPIKRGEDLDPQIDMDLYVFQAKIVAAALVKPKLSYTQLKKVWDKRIEEIYVKYSTAMGLDENLLLLQS